MFPVMLKKKNRSGGGDIYSIFSREVRNKRPPPPAPQTHTHTQRRFRGALKKNMEGPTNHMPILMKTPLGYAWNSSRGPGSEYVARPTKKTTPLETPRLHTNMYSICNSIFVYIYPCFGSPQLTHRKLETVFEMCVLFCVCHIEV